MLRAVLSALLFTAAAVDASGAWGNSSFSVPPFCSNTAAISNAVVASNYTPAMAPGGLTLNVPATSVLFTPVYNMFYNIPCYVGAVHPNRSAQYATTYPVKSMGYLGGPPAPPLAQAVNTITPPLAGFAYCAAWTGECATTTGCTLYTDKNVPMQSVPMGTTMRIYYGVAAQTFNYTSSLNGATIVHVQQAGFAVPGWPTNGSSLVALAAQLANFNNTRDLTLCTTANCNSPFLDTNCSLSSAGFSSLACGGGIFAPEKSDTLWSSAPYPAASPIACYTNYLRPTPVLQLALGSLNLPPNPPLMVANNHYCVSFTVFCGSATSNTTVNAVLTALCNAQNAFTGSSNNSALRIYSDYNTILKEAASVGLTWSVLDSPTNIAATLPAYSPGNYFGLSALMPPQYAQRKLFSDVIVCNTTACNIPTNDTCALGAPISSTMYLSSLFSPSVHAKNGTLKQDIIAAINGALAAGVATSLCPTCTAAFTVAQSIAGVLSFPLPGRRAAGIEATAPLPPFLVSYSTFGASSAALDAFRIYAGTAAFARIVSDAFRALSGNYKAQLSPSSSTVSLLAIPPGLAKPPGVCGGSGSDTGIVTNYFTNALLAVPTNTIKCYQGIVQSNRSSRFAELIVAQQPGAVYCAAFTADCPKTNSCPTGVDDLGMPIYLPVNATMRSYIGIVSMAALNKELANVVSPRDVVVCATDNCASPFTDSCAISAAAGYSSGACGGGPVEYRVVSSSSLTCYSNLGSSGGAPTVQTTATTSNQLCLSFTTVCGATAAYSGADGPCKGVAAGSAVRVYSDYVSFVQKLSLPGTPSAGETIKLALAASALNPLSTSLGPQNPVRLTASNVRGL